MITIRSEKPEDFDTIYEINKKVFNGHIFKVFQRLMILSSYYLILITSFNFRYTFFSFITHTKVAKLVLSGESDHFQPFGIC